MVHHKTKEVDQAENKTKYYKNYSRMPQAF